MSDPNWANVEVLVSGGGEVASTAPLERTGKHAVSSVGTAPTYQTVTGSLSTTGTALDLNKVGGISVTTAFDWGTSWSIEMRIYPDAWGGNQYLIDNRVASRQVTLYVNTGNQIATTIGGSTVTHGSAPTLLTAGSWHSIQLNYDGSEYKLFINGALIATRTFASEDHSSCQLNIGCWQPTPSLYFDGKTEEIRFTKNVVRNTTTYTPATAPFPTNDGDPAGDSNWDDVELLLRGEDVTDSSTNARTITGSPPIVTGKWGDALDLRANSMSMTIPIEVLLGDLTIEYWRYTTSNNNTEDTIFCTAFVGNRVTLAIEHSGATMRVSRYVGSWGYYTTSFTPTLNQWDFIRIKWSAAGKLDVWANGTNVLDTNVGTRSGTSETCYMSRKWDSGGNQFHGWIDDFRITSALRDETTEVPTERFPTIPALVDISGDITGPADVNVLVGQPVTLSVTITPTTGIPPYTIDWYNDDVGLYAADAGTSLEYTPADLTESGMLWWVTIEDSEGNLGQSRNATMAVVGAQLELSWSIEDATSDTTVVVYQSIAWSLADGSTQADYDDFTCPVRTHRAISTEDGHTYWIPFYDKSARCHRGPLVNDRYNRYYWTQDGRGLRYDTFQNLEYNSFTEGYDVGVPPPTKVPAVAAAQPESDSDLLVTRAYVYTYVTVYGEEGPPSPPTTADGVDGELWEISNMLTGPEDDKRRLLASKNIYRTVPAETGVAEYHYVGSVGINTPLYYDRAGDETVSQNRIMECEFWYPPPEDLSGLTAHPNGFFVGYSGRDIYFSEPYRPHAWNPNYIVSTLGEIIGFGVFGTTVVVCTNSFPYTATGIHPQAMVLTQHDTAEPCLSRYGIVSMPFGVYYPGPNGLMLFGSRGLSNSTKELMTKEEWQNRYQVTTFDAARYQSQYVALYNTTKGIMFAPDEPMAALVDIDLAAGTAEPDQADSIFTDEHSGKTYLLSSCDMYEWNPVSGANLEFDWTSMEFDASDPVNFGASRIIWYSDWTPPTEEQTWAWRVFNTARIAAAPLMPMNFNVINGVNVIPNLVYDLTPIDAYPEIDQVKVQEHLDNFEQIKQAFHWGPLVWVPEIGANWPNTPYVVMELIANGQTVYEKEIGHTRMFRLPSGFKATRFRIRLRSNINIQSVKVAETGKELSGF